MVKNTPTLSLFYEFRTSTIHCSLCLPKLSLQIPLYENTPQRLVGQIFVPN
ncbi:hypothetical protein RDI58_001424 [Solanum bulbocastanum]|uniref:Uncharacterized protein n=1 Tax=Solanum bulbocastanum TaxID=147425 RepID=A0AAN8YPY5_SOLBU